jgi:tRNA threonylcarbamoyladenosine biosynthesis protein TsaB
MYVLALTISTDEGSLALSKNKFVIGQKAWSRTAQHTDVLVLNIKKILERSKITQQNLSLIAVDRGPGSFTGCRMAVNVARALAYSLSIPIYSTHSLDIIAESARESLPRKKKVTFLALLNAHKSLTYGRQYEFDGPSNSCRALTDVNAWSLNEILRLTTQGTKVFGDIDKNIKRMLIENGVIFSARKKLNFPQASVLATMADKSEFRSWSEIEPSYIRSPDVVEKFKTMV